VVEAGQPGRRTHQRIAVGRVRDRSVDDPLDAHRAEDRHSPAGGLDVGLETAKIIVEELVRELVGDAVEPVRRRLPLVRTEDQSMTLLAQVVADVRVTQQRQARCTARDQFGNVVGHVGTGARA
jgi:hypothetical protein